MQTDKNDTLLVLFVIGLLLTACIIATVEAAQRMGGTL